jgi:hypothetical protein
MRYRKLRIAISAVGLISWLLLVVFFALSAHRQDVLDLNLSEKHSVSVLSWRSCIYLQYLWASRGTLTQYQAASGWRAHVITPAMEEKHDFSPGPWGWKLVRLPTHNTVQVTVPFWLPMLVASFIGAAPWMQRNFSTRMLLFLTAAIALQVGLVSAFSYQR